MTQEPGSPRSVPPRRRGGWGLAVFLGVLIGALVLATVGAGVWALTSMSRSGDEGWDRPRIGPEKSARRNGPMPRTDPALSSYYEQDLVWQECGDGDECTRLRVPLDYDRPDGRSIRLAVLRVPAQGDAVGSLVVNPGGPGGSGIQYAAAASGAWTQPVLESFDLVGFDPRGVGQSTPLDCMDTKQTDEFVAADPDPDDAAERRAMDEMLSEFGRGCLRESGALTRHISTEEVARDIDILRHALQEPKLDYFGASYGTLIGATYADLFPSHVGRMVLDGAVNPALSNEQLNLQQAAGFETALRAYVADCVDGGDCVLGDDVDAGTRRIRALLEDVERQALPTSADRDLEVGTAFLGVLMPLYVKSYWPLLTGALEQAINEGKGDGLLRLADQYTSRGPGGYDDNSLEALYAVNCLDHSDAVPIDEVPSYFAEFEKASPTLGRAFAFSLSTCTSWPVKSGKVTKALPATGAPPIVVVGTTRDPATPLRWAKALAGQLDSGVLVTRDGDGHTGYNQGNACIDETLEDYLISAQVPEDGLECD